MTEPHWTQVVVAISSALTPILVLVLGVTLTRRQSRSDELVRVRLDYYRQLAPDLNRLMCFMTFIGTWRDDSPAEIVALKRRLDANFHVAAPLFGVEVGRAYDELMDATFQTFGQWGADATLRTSAYRRRLAWQRSEPWEPAWDRLFAIPDEDAISAASLREYRTRYDALIAALATDLSISRARISYTTDRVAEQEFEPKTVPGSDD